MSGTSRGRKIKVGMVEVESDKGDELGVGVAIQADTALSWEHELSTSKGSQCERQLGTVTCLYLLT